MKHALLLGALALALSAPVQAAQVCFDPATAVTPAAAPAVSPLLEIYLKYIQGFHGTTHTDGWNLDEMGATGADRDLLSGMGASIEGRGQ